MSDIFENSGTFTRNAWEWLYQTVDHTRFGDQDAELIYQSLENDFRPVHFGTYLQHFIFKKTGMEGVYTDLPLKDYQTIVTDAFRENGVPATFFLIGQNIDAQSAQVVKEAMSLGCEIACHSWSHSHMSGMTAGDIRKDIKRSTAKIKEITGEDPAFFRPPYIDVSPLMFDCIGMTFISGVGCNDWMPEVSPQERISLVLRGVSDGSIILMHDSAGNDKTVEAIKTLIPELKKRGYEFVTVSELFARKGVKPVKGRVYSNVLQKGDW